MEENMIKIENISKQYRLGAIGGGTLQGDLQSWWARVRGKEDPNMKIGARLYEKNERFMALDGISLEVKKGERVGIIGHNGAGKSTLLKLLSRVTAPTSGQIGLNGRVASMLEVGTGFHGELTGRENVYMNGAILGMTRKEIDAKMDAIIDFSECRQFIDTPVKRYSSGMYVKLAFSVAAHLDSEIMIMDEVLAVGDMAFQKKCLDKMNDVSRSENKTILYVSHNMNTIRQLCERCIVLDHGKVIFDGDVETAIEIYMGRGGEQKTEYNFEGMERVPPRPMYLEMLGLSVPDRTHTTYVQGETIRFLLRCRANRAVENYGFRFEIYSGGNVIGTTFMDGSICAAQGEIITLNISLTTDHFAPGQYSALALIYAEDSYGNQKAVDRVPNALSFKIAASEMQKLNWNTQHWGHIRFNDMHLNDIC